MPNVTTVCDEQITKRGLWKEMYTIWDVTITKIDISSFKGGLKSEIQKRKNNSVMDVE